MWPRGLPLNRMASAGLSSSASEGFSVNDRDLDPPSVTFHQKKKATRTMVSAFSWPRLTSNQVPVLVTDWDTSGILCWQGKHYTGMSTIWPLIIPFPVETFCPGPTPDSTRGDAIHYFGWLPARWPNRPLSV